MVCPAKNVTYKELENIFFENFEELDISKFLSDENVTIKLKKVKENKIAENKYKLQEIDSDTEKILKMIDISEEERSLKIYDKEIAKNEAAKEKLIAENKKLEQEIEELSEQRLKLKRQKDSIKEVYSFLESAKDEQELIDRRIQLRQEIKNMVEWIKIYSLQDEYKEYEEIESGIIRHMASKKIDKIRIKFRGSNRLRAVFLNTAAEVMD